MSTTAEALVHCFDNLSRNLTNEPPLKHNADTPTTRTWADDNENPCMTDPQSDGHYVLKEDEGEEDSDDDETFVWEFREDYLKTDLKVDPRDEGTDDNWVKRNPELVRLTGSHPLNCEPPLSRLMDHGFITPVSLHYISNHGHVPRASWDDWTVEISGLVKRPTKFTMSELVKAFPPRELPVTMVSAGNRGKELNLVKQTFGFKWGAGGLSTSVWRGVRLCDVLKKCGMMSKKKGALYVCFDGSENLPGGLDYGTSIRVDIAMDPTRDVILAYMQNGELLHPDHGFPVRTIVPGFIGGRMIKWLKGIRVTSQESESHYHFHDNRLLPSDIDAEKATAEEWWFRPDYIINELNINSVITTPAQGDILLINSLTVQTPYTIRGYAYSGGGRKIIRVEVTMDGGETWIPCKLNHREKPAKYGKYWCWCFWDVEIDVTQLLGTKELAVRAWDAAMNTQPKDFTWNVMGMMNNGWFRVKLSVCKHKEGGIGLVFEHPTVPGEEPGGWMGRDESNSQRHEKASLHKSFSTPVMNASSRRIAISEVQRHSKGNPNSAWIIIHGHVYDCTKFLKEHPGGADSILINAGTDCTEEFDAIHSSKAKAMLEDYRIGELIAPSGITANSSNSDSDTAPDHNKSLTGLAYKMTYLPPIRESPAPSRQTALDPKQKIPCKLLHKKIVNHDVRVFRFSLPREDQLLGLPVGKHIFVCATINGKLCMRAYTPVSSDDEDIGYIDLLIKIYYRDVQPNFPEGGLMSQYLERLCPGDTIHIKGPIGHIQYEGRGNFNVKGQHKFATKIAMMAGGTGITPMYQVINAILSDPEDETAIFLVYANRTEEDILLREELEERARLHSNFHVWYVISKSVGDGWRYSLGYIRHEVLKEHIPEGSEETLAFLCGPPPMIQLACLPNLEKMKYDLQTSCFQF